MTHERRFWTVSCTLSAAAIATTVMLAIVTILAWCLTYPWVASTQNFEAVHTQVNRHAA